MAQAFCTGPCHVFLGDRNGDLNTITAVVYYGTCEDTPSVQPRPEYEALRNSVSGKKPYDLSFQGEDVMLGFDFTRYNHLVMNTVRGRTVPSLTPVGTFAAGDMGSLALTEGQAFCLWLVFPYATKPAFAAQGMHAGYRFPFCVPVGPDDLGPLGTSARKERVVFQAIAAYIPSTGGHLLYDHNMSGLPPID